MCSRTWRGNVSVIYLTVLRTVFFLVLMLQVIETCWASKSVWEGHVAETLH